jgi:acyl-CoA thioester hydrolase
MDSFSLTLQVRWSDIDANRHLRHSVYYDYGALSRMEILSRIGLTTARLEELGIGPILFREEAVFRKEVVFEDRIRITTELVKAYPDFSRWSIRHHILKEDESLAAILNLDGAWIDMQKRKLAIPDDFVQSIFDKIPKSKEFQFQVKKEAK